LLQHFGILPDKSQVLDARISNRIFFPKGDF
jgi:hypothetical protein